MKLGGLREVKGLVYIEPLPKQRPRFDSRTKTTYTPTATRHYEQQLELLLLDQFNYSTPLDGPIEADVTFYLSKPKSISKKRFWVQTKPDLDNLCKAFYDAAEKAGIFTTDSRIVLQTHEKRYAEEDGPKIVFHFGERAI